jgi:hypothetical protein
MRRLKEAGYDGVEDPAVRDYFIINRSLRKGLRLSLNGFWLALASSLATGGVYVLDALGGMGSMVESRPRMDYEALLPVCNGVTGAGAVMGHRTGQSFIQRR